MEKSSIHNIFKEIDLSDEKIEVLANHLTKVNCKKGELLVRQGESVSNKYFIYSGCLRSFFIDEQGKEHTLQFAIKDWWISDYPGYFQGRKAIMNIECIQDSVLIKMTKNNRDVLFNHVPQLESFFRLKFENTIASFQKRTIASLSYSAKEKYIQFVNTYAEIEQNVRNYHIASYLGITKESLSRIRKEIAKGDS
ncbi:Crp/Fnr family transcriptional regulator [Aquimarina algiphila]|uniref:Crp/Fnr family transcriptional regulator n=1 Tax=Aquimarina algiphila TaxID=2047982 RepID=UPI00248F5186|nr:Crp/Fnr family transcriptional regulator [Aquimarina algiphila]